VALPPDGSSQVELTAASPFPRHYLYDSTGRLIRKSALIRYKDFIRRSALMRAPGAAASRCRSRESGVG
jgi:hypothetical protein